MAARSSAIEVHLPRPPSCANAPLSWALTGALAAVGLCAVTSPVASFLLLLTAWSVQRRFAYQQPQTYPRFALILFGWACGTVVFVLHRSPPPEPVLPLPPRSMHFSFEVERSFNARRADHWAGIGILTTSEFPELCPPGSRIAVYLDSGQSPARQPVRSEILACTAVVHSIEQTPPIERDGYLDYLTGQGIHFTANGGIVVSRVALPDLHQDIRHALYQRAIHLLSFGTVDPSSPGLVLASMLMGERSLLSDDRIQLYKESGTFHLFAVSGLHVGCVALCFNFLFRLLPIPRRFAMVGALVLVWGYVWLAGSAPSAVRAGTMISCIITCKILSRQGHLFPALLLSAAIAFILDPYQYRQLGFQLSYAVVASIVLYGLPLSKYIQDRCNNLPPPGPLLSRSLKAAIRCLQLIAISFSASIVSAPLIITHFNLFTPGGLFAGVFLNLLISACVLLGAVILLLALLPIGSLPGFLAFLAWPLIRFIELFLAGLLAVPGAVANLHWQSPSTGYLAVIAFLAAAWILQILRQHCRVRHPLAFLLPPIPVCFALAFAAPV